MDHADVKQILSALAATRQLLDIRKRGRWAQSEDYLSLVYEFQYPGWSVTVGVDLDDGSEVECEIDVGAGLGDAWHIEWSVKRWRNEREDLLVWHKDVIKVDSFDAVPGAILGVVAIVKSLFDQTVGSHNASDA